jgi:hypothetical protein
MEVNAGRIQKEAVRYLGALNLHFLGRAFHSRGEIHRVPKEAISRHRFTDDAKGERWGTNENIQTILLDQLIIRLLTPPLWVQRPVPRE